MSQGRGIFIIDKFPPVRALLFCHKGSALRAEIFQNLSKIQQNFFSAGREIFLLIFLISAR
jgi:hypothetical protein